MGNAAGRKVKNHGRFMPEGVPVRPVTNCEKCAWWSPTACLKRKAGFPDVGDYCYSYEREPGVEG